MVSRRWLSRVTRQRRKGPAHRFKAAFKSRHKKLYKAFKYLGIVLLIWLIFLAPWPVFR